MSADLAALLYLVAGVLFILALRGLSNPATSSTSHVTRTKPTSPAISRNFVPTRILARRSDQRGALTSKSYGTRATRARKRP